MEEIWKKVDDYEYEVSTFVNVRRIGKKMLKSRLNKRGYYYVTLCKNGKTTTKTIHRLVAETFITNPENKECIDHIDNNPTNSNVSNLRWCSLSENQHNRAKNCNNTSGYKGVSFNKRNQKYHAQIRLNGKRIHIGLFKTAEEAYEAYKQKAIELHKEFAKY